MDWAALREEFPITRNYNFQNHAAVAPMCTRAVQALERFCQENRDHAYLRGGAYKEAERVRQAAARFIGANADEICFIKNTTEGLNFVANGLNWQSGDNVVTTSVEFPANVYCWQALKAHGVQVQMVFEENGRIPLESLLQAINARTRLVALSSVQYASGFRTDLAKLGEFCQEKGVLLCVDAIQSVGAVPLDVRTMNIDFLAADAHKWMCGPEGLGIFYVRKEMQGYLKPSCVGWLSMKNALDFDKYQFEYQDSAKRYDSGAYNLMGIHALGGALDLLGEIGMEKIHHRLMLLTDRLVEGVKAKGYHVVSSRQPGEASGIVAFTSELHDHEKIRQHLQSEHRTIIAVRSKRLRASPHFYTTEREIDQLVEALPRH
ncbi:MAG TPA: aminotransferase class V-fold PLP-dependent enzyme [Phycisphaerae bacterium]|nr:aminotransferase class V-fold PLP-dependent enzyme [Phycisphaerales bacterium]HRX83732.1 aminotransferase class V-fold PLP-dependent enzyme [Phycisphaerae bacterium]